MGQMTFDFESDDNEPKKSQGKEKQEVKPEVQEKKIDEKDIQAEVKEKEDTQSELKGKKETQPQVKEKKPKKKVTWKTLTSSIAKILKNRNLTMYLLFSGV